MDPEQLEHLDQLASEATPGPWVYLLSAMGDPSNGPDHISLDGPEYTVAEIEGCRTGDRDATFIAAARIAVPELVAEVRRLRAQLDQINARHQRRPGGACVTCWSFWPCDDHLTIHPEETP